MATLAKKKEGTYNKHEYDKRIFRILAILKHLKTKGDIDISKLAKEFDVTPRTLQRDIRILRDIGEEIKYDKQKKKYYLLHGRSILLG